MEIGDKIEIRTKDNRVFKGRFIPSANPEIFSIKMNNGYNIGIKKSGIASEKTLQKAEKKQKQKIQIQENKSLPTVFILHTGGTVASEVSYETGAVTPRFTPEELVQKYPEILKIANIKAKLISNKFSEDMEFGDYNIIAGEIQKHINDADGFIITHGTDTMHYTSSALSFMLEDLPKPVLLVGSQRSSDRPSADSFMNLYCAAKFIAETDFAGVAVCMHDSAEDKCCAIIKGTKARKMHTSKRSAFQSINSDLIAKVYFNKIEFKSEYKKRHTNRLRLAPINESIKVGILKIYPGISENLLEFFRNYDGLILEATGLGHLPINSNKKFYSALKSLAEKIPIAIASQCIYGRINLDVYETGRKLKQLGIFGHLTDMTPETAYIKLAWLLSNCKDKKDKASIAKLYHENLRGEIDKRITDFS